MNKKYIYGVAAASLLAMIMTGCGDGSEDSDGTTLGSITEITREPLLSETDRAISDYELRYSTGDFSAEDYLALATLYQEKGLIRRQRDLLEQSYRLYDDQQAFEILQTISVNLEEEDASIQQEAALMLQNLELAEYLDESINLISSSGWFSTMMPKLYEGSRSYFMQRDGETVLFVQAGYNENGTTYSKVWYTGNQEEITLLQQIGNTVQLMRTQMAEGAYQGSFESWLCDGSTGDIYHEQGSFNNGLLTGDYTAAVHRGTEGSDVFSLWSNREGMEYTTYTGSFDEQGRTTVEQPSEKNIRALIADSDDSTCVIYAYDESGDNCLFTGLPEGADPAAYVFDAANMGWKAYPEFAPYEVEKDEEADPDGNEADGNGAGTDGQDTGSAEDGNTAGSDAAKDAVSQMPRIRIYDGEIQLYMGSAWVSAGSVEQLAKEDPFQNYKSSRQEQTEEPSGTATEQKRTSGSIPKEAPVTTTKPATQKPAVQTPAVTPEPTPEPEPEPTPQTPSTPSQPAPTPAPTPAPEPTPAPSTGNGADTDIEWTDDIL